MSNIRKKSINSLVKKTLEDMLSLDWWRKTLLESPNPNFNGGQWLADVQHTVKRPLCVFALFQFDRKNLQKKLSK